jgi:acyl-CoA synthetase (AMP-forming)/AMP-acid ligase II
MVAFLDGRLAPNKRPRTFVFVDERPRNPTHKVLEYELRAPCGAGRDQASRGARLKRSMTTTV